MNLYEISATLENGAVHKTKIYEINQERALNRASKFALQFDATGCAKKTVQLIQKNAGVPKETERAFLNEIKEILEGLGENSYCAMAFEGCVEDAEENINNDFAVSMKGRWESEKKAREETREGLIGKLNDRIKRVAELLQKKYPRLPRGFCGAPTYSSLGCQSQSAKIMSSCSSCGSKRIQTSPNWPEPPDCFL